MGDTSISEDRKSNFGKNIVFIVVCVIVGYFVPLILHYLSGFLSALGGLFQ